jgi:hypothetical protein
MKNITTPLQPSPATATQKRELQHSTVPPSPTGADILPAPCSENREAADCPGGAKTAHLGRRDNLPSETLLALGAIFAEQSVAGMLGDLDEANKAFGVQAGIVVTLHKLIPPEQFRAVMIQWEVDAIKLTDFFALTSQQ